MTERNLNFDKPINRRDTHSLKWDFAVERGIAKPGKSDDLIPLWVADMDFRTSSYIQDALTRQVAHGIFGYSEAKEGYFLALRDFYARRHGLEIPTSDWIIKAPGVMFLLSMAVNAFTEKNDAILIQEPVYMHFRELIEASGRRVVSSDLVLAENGRYDIDFSDFEKKIQENRIKLFFLCNPHNPVSRVWSDEELEKLGEICLRHRVIIASDEIHNDFVFYGKHRMMATLSKEISDITVSVTAPTKTFNLAGLQIAHAFISNKNLRAAIQHEIDAVAYSQVNVAGLIASEAAYRYGEEWLDAMLEYIRGNIDFTSEFVSENLPGITLTPIEATYLAWLNFNGLKKSPDEIDDIILHKAKLWVNNGIRFGNPGRGFERINLACPRSTLEIALKRLQKAFYG